MHRTVNTENKIRNYLCSNKVRWKYADNRNTDHKDRSLHITGQIKKSADKRLGTMAIWGTRDKNTSYKVAKKQRNGFRN